LLAPLLHALLTGAVIVKGVLVKDVLLLRLGGWQASRKARQRESSGAEQRGDADQIPHGRRK